MPWCRVRPPVGEASVAEVMGEVKISIVKNCPEFEAMQCGMLACGCRLGRGHGVAPWAVGVPSALFE